MPYIAQQRRETLDPLVGEVLKVVANSGELNYVITCLIDSHASSRYADFQSVVGLLECIKQEYYRKRVAVYEDIKCNENGEVYH